MIMCWVNMRVFNYFLIIIIFIKYSMVEMQVGLIIVCIDGKFCNDNGILCVMNNMENIMGLNDALKDPDCSMLFG